MTQQSYFPTTDFGLTCKGRKSKPGLPLREADTLTVHYTSLLVKMQLTENITKLYETTVLTALIAYYK